MKKHTAGVRSQESGVRSQKSELRMQLVGDKSIQNSLRENSF
jgi:hypothetical protein